MSNRRSLSATVDPSRTDPVRLRSRFVFNRFARYLGWYFRRNFRAVRLARGSVPDLPPGRPAVIYSNHPSWWDPAFCLLLSHRIFPERPGYGPMDDAALENYGIFKKVGIFGIDPDTARGAARFLSVCERIMADPASMLWITAEGDFVDPRRRPVALRAGIAHLARRIDGVIMVPLAMDYCFWNERFPEALARFGDPIEGDPALPTADWTAKLQAGLEATMDALTADALTRDAARFDTLVGGRRGIGGVYDLWRRLVAAARGHRFAAGHDDAIGR